jgi:hypothetical protein
MNVLAVEEARVFSDETINFDSLELMPLVESSWSNFPNLVAYLAFGVHDREHLRAWARGLWAGTPVPNEIFDVVKRLHRRSQRRLLASLAGELLTPFELCQLVYARAGDLTTNELRGLLTHEHMGVKLAAVETSNLPENLIREQLHALRDDPLAVPLVLALLSHPNANRNVIRSYLSSHDADVRRTAGSLMERDR